MELINETKINGLKKLLGYVGISLSSLLTLEIPIRIYQSDYSDYLVITRGIWSKSVRTSPLIVQTTLDMWKPWQMYFDNYALALDMCKNKKEVKRVLSVGLGGGCFLHGVNHIHPKAEMVAIEIDPVMVEIAKKEFCLPDDVKVIIGDAIEVIKNRAEELGKFDFIFIDIFNDSKLPEELLELNFFSYADKILNENGVIIANLVRTRKNDIKYGKIMVNFKNVFEKVVENIPKSSRLALYRYCLILSGVKKTYINY